MLPPDQKTIYQRFWCPRGGRYATDSEGFVRPPDVWQSTECWEPTLSPRLTAMPCLILLGEPGIGKSCALRDMFAATQRTLLSGEGLILVDLCLHCDIDDLIAMPAFRAWRAGESSLCLFIDSLDERRNADDASRLLGTLQGGPLHRLRLRVACRTGDLPACYGNGLGTWWGDERAVAHLELLPLTRDDVLGAARFADIDAEAFIADVLRRDVVALATRPITLRFLIDLFSRHRRLSKDRCELYKSGCEYLCREYSNTRRDHEQCGRLDIEQRLAIARRLAAVSLLAQKQLIYLERPLTELAVGAVVIDVLVGMYVDETRTPFTISADAVEEVITQTGLFTARGDDCFGWSHLTYAEFLAAEFLSCRVLGANGLRQILTPAPLAGQVPSALRGVASWLLARSSDLFSALLTDDVSVFLHADLGEFSDAQRAAIVARLLDCAGTGAILEPRVPGTAYLRLYHPGLAEQLRRWIEDRQAYFVARHIAINIAEGCVLTSLVSSLLGVACSEEETDPLRAEALIAFTEMAGPESRGLVRPLLTTANDPNDQLRGHALAFIRPDLDADELIRHLVMPKRPSYLGSYYYFINHELVPGAADGDLPRLLDWLRAYREQQDSTNEHYVDRAASMIHRRAWMRMHHPDVMGRLRPLVEARLRRGEDVFGGQVFYDLQPTAAALLDDRVRRHMLVSALVDSDEFPQIGGFRLSEGCGLIRADDLDWLVQEFERHSDGVRRDRWMELIVTRMHRGGCSEEHTEMVIDLAGRYPILKQQLRWLIGPIYLDSPEVEGMRQNERANTRAAATFQEFTLREGSNLPPVDRLLHLLGRMESGDDEAISSIFSALRANAGRWPYFWKCADPSQLPGWVEAPPEVRERILGATRAFLVRDGAASREWLTNPSQAAYLALRLLVARDRNWLLRQRGPFWRRWAPTIVVCPIADKALDHGALLKQAQSHAPTEFLWALAIKTDIETRQGHVTTVRGIGDCWTDSIGALLLAKAQDPEIPSKGLGALLEVALGRSVTGARAQCLALLAGAANDRAEAGAQALLIADAEYSWPMLLEAFATNPVLERAILHELSSETVVEMARRCTAQLVEDMYRWIAMSRRNAPEHVDKLLGAIRKDLTCRGTLEALETVRSLQAAFPESDVLGISHGMARESLCAMAWTPWAVDDVLLLRRGSTASGSESARRALDQRLCDVFGRPAVVQDWLRRVPLPEIELHELPLEASSFIVWMTQFVDRLLARGIGADDFCDQLAQGYPNCPQTISEIRSLWAAVSRD